MDTIKSSTVTAKYRGPDLTNSARFVRIQSVPIIDVLERSYFKKDEDGNDVQVKESVDENQLKVLLKNSQELAKEVSLALFLSDIQMIMGAKLINPL